MKLSVRLNTRRFAKKQLAPTGAKPALEYAPRGCFPGSQANTSNGKI